MRKELKLKSEPWASQAIAMLKEAPHFKVVDPNRHIEMDFKLAYCLARGTGLKTTTKRHIWKRTKRIFLEAIVKHTKELLKNEE